MGRDETRRDRQAVHPCVEDEEGLKYGYPYPPQIHHHPTRRFIPNSTQNQPTLLALVRRRALRVKNKKTPHRSIGVETEQMIAP